MPKNPFTSQGDYVDKPKRNTFDLSFQNNLTMKFGRLYPVFCKEVVPGDSFKIEPTFGLRFMPLVFPIQTRMQANLHFFYVRNRNLWKDWPDFIGRTKSNLVPPYLSSTVAKQVCKTGALGDYFGLPTTLVGEYGSQRSFASSDLCFKLDNRPTYRNYAIGGSFNSCIDRTLWYISRSGSPDIGDNFGFFTPPITSRFRVENGHSYFKFKVVGAGVDEIDQPDTTPTLHLFWRVGDDYVPIAYRTLDNKVTVSQGSSYDDAISALTDGLSIAANSLSTAPSSDCYCVFDLNSDLTFSRYSSDYVDFNAGLLIDFISALSSRYGNLDYRLAVSAPWPDYGSTQEAEQAVFLANSANIPPVGGVPTEVILDLELDGVSDLSDVGNALNPYATGDIKVSALPFRAYESIYNCFYRNQFNDPFKINGVVEYNKFITTNEGGSDSTPYDFFNRNYEMDFLTSARQSPVDGDITPLVGVSGTGQFTFKNSDDTTYTVTPIVGDDGHTLTGIQSVEGTPENNSGIRRLTDMISVGISINDFRNVNALQRWLETNLRRGYRYKDQIMSHFGVDVRYDELDMPEFIGGMSEPVLVNQVSQTVDATDNASGLGDFSKVLGSFAGQASVLASSNHDITKYCDEHGFIIGVMSISPVPNYSQLLPKMFVKDNVLDYYFPEFGHIGNQPIPYREVVPLQSFAAGDALTDVFGYQRAWYDYLAAVDEVHGDFRTSLDGFLINRVFAERPELGRKFIEVDADSMSNPFSVTTDGDKILGQLYFKVTAQRPIPKYGIPRLE